MKQIDFRNSDVRTWLEIDKKALKNNYLQFRKIIGKDCLLMGVVKSNAYGHGLIGYSEALDSLGVDWFGVDSFIEARKLREAGITEPILVLGYTLPQNFEEAAENGVSLTISNCEALSVLCVAKLKNPLNIHLKIDSGMHRQGFVVEELRHVVKQIKGLEKINIEGVYTHFASAKNPAIKTETQKQLEVFDRAIKIIENEGFSPIKHAAASAGAIIMKESHFDLIRIGIGLMGIWPSIEAKAVFGESLVLEPVLSWRTIVSEIKEVKKDERVGYGFSETLRRDSKIAILPVGYWHGFRWALSSIGNVIIRGRRCKVVGRVSMDMIVVDVTDIENIEINDIVTLIGKDGNEEIAVEEFAHLSGSYSYEVITTLNPLIKRLYI